MVESGKIEWSCHANDAAASIHDTPALDRAVARAVDFHRLHPADTPVIVTGDHETGGTSIGFAGIDYEAFFDKVSLQKVSYVRFDTEVLEPYRASHPKDKTRLTDLLGDIQKHFGLKPADLNAVELEMVERAFLRSMGGKPERAVSEDAYLLYDGYEPLTVTLTHLLNEKAGIVKAGGQQVRVHTLRSRFRGREIEAGTTRGQDGVGQGLRTG